MQDKELVSLFDALIPEYRWTRSSVYMDSSGDIDLVHTPGKPGVWTRHLTYEQIQTLYEIEKMRDELSK